MIENKKKVIAAFDFDGTITTKDTLFDFIRSYFGTFKLVLGIVILSPILILYKIGFIKNYRAKEILISYFLKNKDFNEFTQKCNLYSQRINLIVRPKVLQKIQWHIQQKHKVIIVSASVKDWIQPWANENGISEVIGTEIQIQEGKITGKFSTKNCYGQEKVNRLKEVYPNREEYTLYAYGDSRGDQELLAFADHPSLIKNNN